MGLAKTFTNSIVREIGRNYGKAASNYLLGDKHSTPVRVIRYGDDVSRKRGTKYHNNYDKAILNFEIKGAQATFNQVLNIHGEYFSLVEEANSDNKIDLSEMSFLVREIPRGISVLEKAKSALIDLGKTDLAEKAQEKIESFKDFMKSLDDALKIENLPSTNFSLIAFLFFFLSFIGLDRLYFKPKNLWSYFYALIGISFPYFLYNSEIFDNKVETNFYLLIYGTLSVSMPFWYGMILNPLKTGGYWEYRKNKKYQKTMNKLAIALKKFMSQQISKY